MALIEYYGTNEIELQPNIYLDDGAGDGWLLMRVGTQLAAGAALAASLASAQLAQPAPRNEQNEQGTGLHGQPEEEYWQNQVKPYNEYKFTVPDPYRWEQNEQGTGLHGQPEEEYWQNQVPPTPVVFIVPAPWIWEQDEQGTGLYGQ